MPLVSETPSVAKPGKQEESLPRLENGDHLSSREFLRRYEAMPELRKAELIEGQVYMGSPASYSHAKPDGLMHLLCGTYAARTDGVEFLPNATLVLDSENTIRPDAMLRILPLRAGATRLEDDLIVGAPELILEIAASSVSIDLHAKFRACQRNGVQEYVVWLVRERQIRWFLLEDERYIQQTPDTRGLLSSRVFPGLVLSMKALLEDDAAGALAALEDGFKTPAYTAFAARLRHASDSPKA